MPQNRTATSLTELYEREHFVQYYDGEGSLIDSLTSFIGAGLGNDDACIVIATPEHRNELDDELDARGIDASRMISLDAAEVLDKFMVKRLPSRELFRKTIGSVLDKCQNERPIRAFGEMVALLWAQDNEAGAVLLEQLWNELGRDYAFTLFCAYPMSQLSKRGHQEAISRINRLHSCSITPERLMSAQGGPSVT